MINQPESTAFNGGRDGRKFRRRKRSKNNGSPVPIDKRGPWITFEDIRASVSRVIQEPTPTEFEVAEADRLIEEDWQKTLNIKEKYDAIYQAKQARQIRQAS